MSVKNIGGDWVQSHDPGSGKMYYANTVTQETSWEWPADVPMPEDDEELEVDAAVDDDQDWTAAFDEGSGKHYYHNRATGETTWTRPEGFVDDDQKAEAAAAAAAEAAAAAAEDPDADPDNWISKDDAASGMTYYHNHVTGETTWTKPACLESTTYEPPIKEDEFDPNPSVEASVEGGGSEEEEEQEGEGGEPELQYRTTESKLSALRQMSIEDDFMDAATTEAASSSSSSSSSSEKVVGTMTSSGHHNHAGALSDDAAAIDDPMHEKGMTAVAMLGKFTDLHPDGSTIETSELLKPLENIRFVEFAETNYNFMRKGLLGFKTTTQKITSWKGGKDCIKTSLLNLNDKELVSEAVQCFRNITGWCGDRGSGKDPTSHCLKLLNSMLQQVDNLRNEMYCQICKQTTNNNEQTNKDHPMSNILAWQLMIICLACFPPGPLLKDYLAAHCKENMEGHPSAEVRKYAEHALHCIPRIVALGARRELPTHVELEATRRIEPVTVRVSFLDKKYIMMPVNSWTTAVQFQNMVAFRLGIRNNRAFCIYEVSSKDEERPLDPDERILDLVAYWTRLNTEERSKKGKNAEVEEFHFVYKVRLFLDVPDDDHAAVEMMYIQATHDVVDARYPCSEQDSITLAALQVQEEFGDHPGDDCRYLTGNLPKYLASKYMDTTSATELEEHVLKLYSKLNGYSQQEARLSYLDYVKSWKIYGSSYYFAEPQNNKSFPPEIVLAVNAKGILVVDPERAETKDSSDPTRRFLEEYPYNKVVTWGHSPNSFVIVLGNMMNQKKIYFKTEQGKEINRMVRAYVENLMKGKDE